MPTRPRPTLAESRAPRPSRPRRRRRGLVVLVVVALVAVGAWFGARFLYTSVVNPTCTISAGGMTETFALTTAFQESKIRNLRYGDRDSLGLFQQRPSQGWGTEKQILDMVHATNAFYDALVKFKGYQTADITTIAQKVQRSGFPEAYRDHEGQGRVLASTLTGQSPAGLTCRLDAVKTSVGPERVASDLAEQMGITSVRSSPGKVVVTAPNATLAWAVAHWGVARADQYGATRVAIGDRVWDRSKGGEGWSPGSAGTTVTITLG